MNRRQNESGVLRGGKNLHREQILATLYFSANLVGFAIKSITDCGERQDGFVNFITLKNYINGQKYDDEYVRIKNGKFNFRGMNFIRQ